MKLKKIYKENLQEKERGVMYASFYRLLAPPFVKFFLKINLSANLITFLSLILNVTAFIFYLNFSFWGIVFHEFSIIFDYTDGSVARMQKLGSKFGEWFDLFADRVGYYLLITGISIGLFLHYGNYSILLLGFLVLATREFKAYNEGLTLKIFGVDLNKGNKEGLKRKYGLISRIIALFIDLVYLLFPFVILFNFQVILVVYLAYIAIELFQTLLNLYFIFRNFKT